MVWEFTLPFRAVSKKNNRPIGVNKGGMSFVGKSKALREFEKKCYELFKEQMKEQKIEKPIRIPLSADFIFRFNGKQIGDIDGMVTSVMDALQGKKVRSKNKQKFIEKLVIDDDKQFKQFSAVVVENTGEPDCVFIKMRPYKAESNQLELSSNYGDLSVRPLTDIF